MKAIAISSISLLGLLTSVLAFLPSTHRLHKHRVTTDVPTTHGRTHTSQYLFRKIFRKGDKNDGEEDCDDKTSTISLSEEPTDNDSSTDSTMFFATTPKESLDTEEDTIPEVEPIIEPTPQMKALEQARKLREEAKRAKLQAEKMDIMLTMEKIEKLTKELNSPKVQENPQEMEKLQESLMALQKKLTSTTSKTTSESSKDTKEHSAETEQSNLVATATTTSAPVVDTKQAKIEQEIENFEKAPTFMKRIIAKTVSTSGNDSNLDIADTFLNNATMINQFITQMVEDEEEYLKLTATTSSPTAFEESSLATMDELNITDDMIQRKIEEVKWMPSWLKGDNETELAIALLKAEQEWNGDIRTAPRDGSGKNMESSDDGEQTIGGLFGTDSFEISDTDRMIETLLPKSTRKEGEEPTMAQVETLMTEVLTRKKLWSTSGPIEKVPGGYLLRGTPGLSKYEDVTNGGDVLIEDLDEALEGCSSLRNQLSVFYIFDPTPVSDEQRDLGERPPVLYVTGPDVSREPAPVALALVSGIGFATCWFTSIYPFLLNEKVMKLVDEQVALADASMPSNLEFVNDMAFPIFLGLVAIQFTHEVAHAVVAKSNGLRAGFPTLVPSFTTGLSGAITPLKAPPKNKQQLFDFAIAGPLTGMVSSILLLITGLYSTMMTDAATYANLPALPLSLLRQSSLAGGIIDLISPGLLTVPDAALGSQAISNINIPLHPLAIAGYFGLLVNALNLLPLGRIDGGRIGLTLFGRSGSQLAGFITMVLLFIQGIFGSDVLLFFFSYVIFFQGELEIPQRNEVDDMEFSRVIMATLTGVLVLLTLIPM